MPYDKSYLDDDYETNVRFTDRTHKIMSQVLIKDFANVSELKNAIIEKLKEIAEERNLGTVVTIKLKARLAKILDARRMNTDDLYLADENGCQFYSRDSVYQVYKDSEKIQVLYKSQDSQAAVARKRMKKSPEVKVEVE